MSSILHFPQTRHVDSTICAAWRRAEICGPVPFSGIPALKSLKIAPTPSLRQCFRPIVFAVTCAQDVKRETNIKLCSSVSIASPPEVANDNRPQPENVGRKPIVILTHFLRRSET